MGQLSLGFVVTNFNNSQLTLNALRSIKDNFIGGDYLVSVVDNNSSELEKNILVEGAREYSNVELIFNSSNVGYFDGLNVGIKSLIEKISEFDFIIVGNNDLTFGTDFFDALVSDSDALMKHFVICPDLITLDGVHQNPHVFEKISRFREIVWDIYYSNYYLAKAISYCVSKMKHLVERKDYVGHDIPGHIYRGYGACYILTPTFFENFENLWSPGFLMNEEFYLSVQLESVGSKMFYFPKAQVQHHDHATVSKLPGRKLWEYSKDSHLIYRCFFSPYRVKMRNAETMASFMLTTAEGHFKKGP